MNIVEIKDLPLMGCIAFGIIDRGTNLLQVRCTSVCNLNCIFCFTDAGTTSKNHQVEYIVDKDLLINWIKKVIELKQEKDIEINLDSAGEVTTYKDFLPLVKEIRKLPEVKFISMQSNGFALTESLIDQLAEAGLNRINLSLHTLDLEKSKRLMGCSFYSIEKIKDRVKYIVKSTIELELAPVWMHGLNDKDIEDIIVFAKEAKCKVLIQKYVEYAHSRTIKVKDLNWYKFYRQLTEWEKKYDIKLKYGPKDFNLRRTKKIPLVTQVGNTFVVKLVERGWLKGEMLAIYNERLITIEHCNKKIGDKVKVKITNTKEGIYHAKKA